MCLDATPVIRDDKPLSNFQLYLDEVNQQHYMLNGWVTAFRRATLLGKGKRKEQKDRAKFNLDPAETEHLKELNLLSDEGASSGFGYLFQNRSEASKKLIPDTAAKR